MPVEERTLTSGALFEDGEVEVIGDEPGNTVDDRNCPRLLCRGTKES
jgi:hypothetical protein